jgi:phosphate transport system substrate-binding protein
VKSRILALSLATALGATVAFPALAAELVISGSTTVQKRIVEPAAAKLKDVTGIDAKFQGVGTGKGLMALAEGKVTVAAASETLAEAIDSARKQAADGGKTFEVPANLKFYELAKDSIVVIVNKDNPVGALSKEQLKAINTGKARNWKDVGGPDLPIKVVTSHAGSATRNVFAKQVMDGAAYVADAVEVRTTREEINEVSKDKGAIGAVSEGFYEMNKGNAKLVKAPAISRPLGLITKGDASPEVLKVVDFFVKGPGKALIQ